MSSKEYHRAYYQKNKAKYLERSRLQRLADPEAATAASRRSHKKDREFKKNLLAEFSCICCRESDPDMIDWHHVDPSNKLFNVTDTTKSHDKWWNEVLKCVPVCVSCHRKIHKGKLCLINPTGSRPQQATENTCVRVCTCHQ